MPSKEEIEKARDILLRGNDIESAAIILEAVIMDNVIITGGRVNILRIATRQILNFLNEYKDKDYLKVVSEKVKANEKNRQLEAENKEVIEKEKKTLKLLLELKKDLIEELKYNSTKREARLQLIIVNEMLEILKGEKK